MNKPTLWVVLTWMLLGAWCSVASQPSDSSSSTPPVKVQVRAPWQPIRLFHRGSPLLLEILEAASAQQSSSFFPLLTQLAASGNHHEDDPSSSATVKHRKTKHAGTSLSQLTENQLVQMAQQLIISSDLFDDHRFNQSESVKDPSLQSWKLSLALHDHSPRVQAFVQLYQTLKLDQRWNQKMDNYKDGAESCISWVDWNGAVLCDHDELIQAIEADDQQQQQQPSSTEPVRLLPFDHVLSSLPKQALGSPEQLSAKKVFILYGDPYSPNFASLHSLLETYATGTRTAPHRSQIVYVLRWRPSPSTPESQASEISNSASIPSTQFLAGYGAILDLKKVDYLVIDDRKLKDDSNVGTDGSFQMHSDEPEQPDASVETRQWLQSLLGPTDLSQDDSLLSLSAEELKTLGARAVQLIMSSASPLDALQELSQNFPLYAVGIARSQALDAQQTELLVDSLRPLAQRLGEPGISDVWVNGRNLDLKEFDPLGLINTIKTERQLFRLLTSGVPGARLNVTQAIDLISSSLAGKAFAATSEGASRAFFDASDRIEKSEISSDSEKINLGAITYFNDLATDPATAYWPSDIANLLQPLWPGQFPQLSINLFNVIFIMDLSKRETCKFLSESILASIGKIGLRWGFVPGGLENASNVGSLEMARMFWELYDLGGVKSASQFLKNAVNTKGNDQTLVDLTKAKEYAKVLVQTFSETQDPEKHLEDVVLGRVAKHQVRERMAKAYIQRLRAVESESPRGHVFVNGLYMPFSSQIVQHLNQAVHQQIQTLAPLIYFEELTSETTDLGSFFYNLPEALNFRSKLVHPPEDSGETVQASRKIRQTQVNLVNTFSLARSPNQPKFNLETLWKFIYPSGLPMETKINSTVWLVGDLDSEEGVLLLKKTLEAMSDSKRSLFRLGFLHLPTAHADTKGFSSKTPIPLSAYLHQLMELGSIGHVSPAQLLDEIARYVPPSDNLDQDYNIDRSDSKQKVFSTDETKEAQEDIAAVKEKGWATPGLASSSQFWESVASFAAEHFGIDTSSGLAILINDKLFTGFSVDEVEARDILALVDFHTSSTIPVVVAALAKVYPSLDSMENVERANLILLATSVLSTAYKVDEATEGAFVTNVKPRTSLVDELGSEKHVIEIGNFETAHLRFSVVLDPLSETAQKWSSILTMLADMEGVYLRVILYPKLSYSELPLKRFYRFSSPKELRFDSQGQEVAHELRFLDMPQNAVLTLGLDVPPAWLTMPEEAIYDLDNIRLKDVPTASKSKGVKAIYELKHILIEGHARDVQGPVPRGLQLLLETPDGSKSFDTIVMANLAYFQFKAQPGLWKLRIRPGRTDQLYEMISVGNVGWDSPEVSVTGDDITLDTLSGLTIYPRVKKRPGMEDEALLEELDAQGRPISRVSAKGGDSGLLGAAHNVFRSAKKSVADLASKATGTFHTSVSRSPHADINIFTVASGHLYERMAYIMILSVMKHTDSSVKFWFIENFLSPSFKEFIPHLAEEYGFRYELVTYAWPHWLRSQKEKQRTIWGYKILFLDTLFPLDLTKVIFVDADQVVRTDLKELVDLDLNGAVYGYPPMGDDSEDMDGYRFWKQGYWKDYLRGRPYHISALYVVDLNRFRLFAAGDRMRGQYQALSADPNSLANLDQDLPNNMQAMLPIFTLDKTWLWCETWCSHDWLPQAKTIDLCSNPKTKEPKLDRAKRQIPEWTTYDEQVAQLAQKLVDKNRIGNNFVQVETISKPKTIIQPTIIEKEIEGEEEEKHIRDEL